MQQMRSPLSALRTFGKLLNRRLQREGGLNLELAQNIMAQSDRIAELLNPFTAGTLAEMWQHYEEARCKKAFLSSVLYQSCYS